MTDDDPIPRAVLRALPRKGGAATPAELAKWTGFQLYTVRGALIRLRLAGQITRRPHRTPRYGQQGWEYLRTPVAS